MKKYIILTTDSGILSVGFIRVVGLTRASDTFCIVFNNTAN